MRNKGMTTRTVVTVLTREESILCVMDERWFGCVYFHRLLLVNKHACPALSVHLLQPTRRLSKGQPGPGSLGTDYDKGGKEFLKHPGVQQRWGEAQCLPCQPLGTLLSASALRKYYKENNWD